MNAPRGPCLALRARDRAVEDVEDGADQERQYRRRSTVLVDQHGGDDVQGEPERGDLVGGDGDPPERLHDVGDDAPDTGV